MNSIRILCVENQPDHLYALKYMLENAGYEVKAAATGGEAIDVLHEEAIDGVLLEYDLPDATGSSVRSEMKRIKPDVPVLLFSGVGTQTPFLLRFFDAYLRHRDQPEWRFEEHDS